jgi:glutamate carboxypeptidase
VTDRAALGSTERSVRVGREAHTRLRELRTDFVALLRDLVLAESPSTLPAAQVEVRARLESELHDLGFEVEYLPGTKTGGMLRATMPNSNDSARQLLLAHMDTVWDLGTLARMPAEVDGSILRGPGSFDMKCGIAQGLFALRVLRDAGETLDVTPVFLITSDEEIGSPESADTIFREARRSERVFVVEPALGVEGLIKTRRKGVGQFDIEIFGVSAHGGLAPEEGASAVLELARLIGELDRLQDLERGITVNVGVVSGGVRANVVPDYARAEVDVRAWSTADAEWIEKTIRSFEPTVRGTRIEVSGGFGRPPLEKTPGNDRLWTAARAVGQGIGVELREGSAGGASDGNFTSQYAPTLDGIGAVGDGAHADHEYVDIDRSLERAAILAGVLSLPGDVESVDA